MRIKNFSGKKELHIIEAVVIIFFVVAMIYLAWINYHNRISLVEPINGASVLERNPNFRWAARFDNYEVIIDEVSDFSSPIVKEKVIGTEFISDTNLNFDKYYWKVKAFDEENKEYESKLAFFVLDSIIGLELNEDGSDYLVQNIGSGEEQIEVRELQNDNWNIIGAVVLDVKEILKKGKTENKTLFVAKQI